VTRDERIRLFCALELPEDARAHLAAWGDEALHGGRRVRADDLHVTLAFLGSRPRADVPGIAAELGAAASSAAGRIELQPRSYRETRGAGMIVLDDMDGRAAALAADLRQRLERLGVLRPTSRPWLPHVTVVRFRKPAGLHPPVANMCSIHVVRSALYRSSLGSGGARYDALETAALGVGGST